MIFNKIDNYKKIDFNDSSSNNGHFSLLQWRNTWMNKTNVKALFISAKIKLTLITLERDL